jgi:hypothetical protein
MTTLLDDSLFESSYNGDEKTKLDLTLKKDFELLEMFKGLAVGLEYSEDSWRKVIKELGELYTEEDADNEIDGFVRGLNESEIDAALREHNRHEEELEEWDTTNLDGLPKVDPTNL